MFFEIFFLVRIMSFGFVVVIIFLVFLWFVSVLNLLIWEESIFIVFVNFVGLLYKMIIFGFFCVWLIFICIDSGLFISCFIKNLSK